MTSSQAADPASQTPRGVRPAQAGDFQWDAGYPATLHDLWSPDQANVLLRGAVMAFEAQHNMTIDGSLTPHLWKALFRAPEASGDTSQVGYTYAIANKGSPETLTIWHDGREVFRSLANTGIPVSPTVDSTFPVSERFRYTIMSGTNPDGSQSPTRCRSCPTSTAATRCTTSRAAPTAPSRAWAASSCPTTRLSAPTRT